MGKSSKPNNNTNNNKNNNKNNNNGDCNDQEDITNQQRDDNLQTLLNRKKLNLVLDLDNTLIHGVEVPKKLSTNDKEYNKLEKSLNGDLHDIGNGTYVVKLRKGVHAFLKEASTMFDLSIYTMGSRDYAGNIVKLLDVDNDGLLFKKVISKDDNPKEKFKGLHHVVSHERVVLVVDDLLGIWRECDREDVINVVPYRFLPDKMSFWPKLHDKEDDDELARVLRLITEVHSMFYSGRRSDYAGRDVRKLLKNARSQHAKVET